MMIFLGFILGFVFALILGRIGSHHLARKGNRLKHENGEGVKYKC